MDRPYGPAFLPLARAENAILQAELSSLKGQLHPHFLFNSLNNIYALALNNAPQTPGIILGLSNILRYVIYECTADRVSLERDIEIMQDYIRLEQLRYEDRLDLNVRIFGDPPGHWQIAPLLMLPWSRMPSSMAWAKRLKKPGSIWNYRYSTAPFT